MSATSEMRAHAKAIELYEFLRDVETGRTDPDDANIFAKKMAVEVLTRMDWYSPGEEIPQAGEFMILLSASPAVRIYGRLNNHRQPIAETIQIDHQDFGEPWQKLPETPGESETLTRFVELFTF